MNDTAVTAQVIIRPPLTWALAVSAGAFGRPGSAPIHPDTPQHVIGIVVRIGPKNGSGRNMDCFENALNLNSSRVRVGCGTDN